MTAFEIVQLMNEEDRKVADAIKVVQEPIAKAVEVIADRIRNGGRLIYVGAGTSGRLGVLDASECPPTFRTDPSQVVGLIAGGYDALVRSIEGAEDHPEYAETDLKRISFSSADALVGIATSGRTPYVIGALQFAKQMGAARIAITCNPKSPIDQHTEILINPVVGPEILSGSTRLKAGTATKMVLNMLTTGAMVLLGKTFGNLMVDLRASNEKLVERSIRILEKLTKLPLNQCKSILDRCSGEVKTAIICHHLSVEPQQARELLDRNDGKIRALLESDS